MYKEAFDIICKHKSCRRFHVPVVILERENTQDVVWNMRMHQVRVNAESKELRDALDGFMNKCEITVNLQNLLNYIYKNNLDNVTFFKVISNCIGINDKLFILKLFAKNIK